MALLIEDYAGTTPCSATPRAPPSSVGTVGEAPDVVGIAERVSGRVPMRSGLG
jgi:hypothetical protein